MSLKLFIVSRSRFHETRVNINKKEEKKMSINRDTRLYTVNEVLDTVRKTYEDKDEVWNFISDLTGISADRLYEMIVIPCANPGRTCSPGE